MASEVSFTPSQLNAINTKDKTLLVSAGAGSGKTTVLTKRIIESIKAGTDINSLLVVTFTKAAAATMKDRIYSALLEELAANPSDKRMVHTIYNIPSAKISTIHAFCLDLVSKNFSVLSLPPSMRVADKAESEILLDTCLEDLIDNSFEDEDSDFLTLCDAFSGEKSLDRFKETVIAVYKKYLAFPFWKEYVAKTAQSETRQAESAKEEGIMSTGAGREILTLMRERVDFFHRQANEFYAVLTPVAKPSHLKALDYISDFLLNFKSIINKANPGYDEIKNALDSADIPRIYKMGLPEDIGNAYARLKTAVDDEIKTYKDYFDSAEEETVSDYEKASRLNSLMNSFIISLDESYAAAKKARGILTFSDLEQFTLRLLGEPTPGGTVRTPLCREIRESFSEIYIDEYQDINPLQDMIFSLLSKENNRFMVGDVKQSIYRFRNAKADIFLNYLKEFPPLGEKGKTAKILLPENHRSQKYILDFVNLLFDNLYTEENMNASYKEERLVYPEGKSGNYAFPVNVYLLENEKEPNEKEAEYVAKTIYRLVNGGIDGKKYEYGDIALLLRSMANSTGEYERAFAGYGIPYSLEKNGEFMLEPEILLALSILRIMDNPLDDISLAASLRSPVFCFTADELYAVKRFYAMEFLYDCVSKCALDYRRFLNAGKKYKADKDFRKVKKSAFPFVAKGVSSGERPDNTVKRRCYDFIERLKGLRALADESPTNRLIWEMYMKTSLISLCASGENGKKKVQNLYTLYNYALEFERTSFKGLSSFLSYINDIADSYGEGLSSDTGDKNRVKIMSIHKSKGMEFPVCFVSSLGKRFNISDVSAKYIVRDDGFTLYNLRNNEGLTEYVPFVKKVAANAEKKALYREELRILYVALTRAKERLFVSGAVGKTTLEKGTGGRGFFRSTCYADWIYPILTSAEHPCFMFDNTEPAGDTVIEKQEKTEREFFPDEVFEQAIGFVYPHGRGYTVPAKAAVSELRKGILEDGEYIRSVAKSEAGKIPVFARRRADYASIGNATHLFMQFADFGNVEKDGALAEIDRLIAIKMITPEEGNLIDIKGVEEFFKSTLKAEISRSPLVFREKRFNLIEKSSLVSGEEGELVMIQGVIDCFFQNPDGSFTVVDYKTDRLPEKGGEEVLISRHGMQIKYYCRAAEKITGRKVSKAYLYSFYLGKAIEVDYES